MTTIVSKLLELSPTDFKLAFIMHLCSKGEWFMFGAIERDEHVALLAWHIGTHSRNDKGKQLGLADDF